MLCRHAEPSVRVLALPRFILKPSPSARTLDAPLHTSPALLPCTVLPPSPPLTPRPQLLVDVPDGLSMDEAVMRVVGATMSVCPCEEVQ